MKNKPENVHHIISQCMRNEYKIDVKENKLRMQVSRHNALHALFWCLHTPKEQIMEMYNIYESILWDTAKNLFNELMNLEDNEFYIQNVLKNGKKRR